MPLSVRALVELIPLEFYNMNFYHFLYAKVHYIIEEHLDQLYVLLKNEECVNQYELFHLHWLFVNEIHNLDLIWAITLISSEIDFAINAVKTVLFSSAFDLAINQKCQELS